MSGKAQMMYFGCICQGCIQFARLGKIYIEPNAPPSKLHERLQETNWVEDWAICEDPKCGHRTFVKRSQTILDGPVETSPDGVELP
jgi:hypothetical protein